MPTPNHDEQQIQPVGVVERLSHITCPPERERPEGWRPRDDLPTRPSSAQHLITGRARGVNGEMRTLLHPESTSGDHVNRIALLSTPKHTVAPEERDPASTELPGESGDTASRSSEQSMLPAITGAIRSSNLMSSASYDMFQTRVPQRSTSSFLRIGSKFEGNQQSDKQRYKVEVEIKNIDMDESFLCGYLRIEGLTAEHLVLTTYFEGELIGSKYSFATQHPSWGANEKTDMHHWHRFPPWRPLAKDVRKPDFHIKDYRQKEHIFMRWKESFLVPDHRIRTIPNASFEGFYYICFSQVTGDISGIYFHSTSEKDRYQQLELKHVPDRGCFPAIEFR